MKTVTLEEHFVTDDFLRAAFGAGDENIPAVLRKLRPELADLGAGRIRAMDEGGVGVQVLSLAAIGIEGIAAGEQTAVLRGVHDELASALTAHPERFRGFATPGLKDPLHAVRELDRCMKMPGFVGLLINGTTEGKFLDAPEFFPLLEASEAMDVPLYLHPAPPPQPVFDAYYAGLPGGYSQALSIAGWGWHSETAIHVLRLILSGTLDRLPKLKLIIGHMGEGLPFSLARIDSVFGSMGGARERSISETLRAQVYVTTSGFFTQPPFDCAVETVGLDHLMYSVDYPFSPNTKGKQFLESLELTEPEREAFVYGTAARILKL